MQIRSTSCCIVTLLQKFATDIRLLVSNHWAAKARFSLLQLTWDSREIILAFSGGSIVISHECWGHPIAQDGCRKLGQDERQFAMVVGVMPRCESRIRVRRTVLHSSECSTRE